MSLTKKHRRPYAFLYLLIMVVSAINLQRSANITAAQSTSSNVTLTETSTSSETPVPLSSIYPTLTPPPPPRITPTSRPSATQPRVRTAIPTASPTDTPTSTPIVQARPTVVSTGPLLAQEITLAALGRTNLDFLPPESTQEFTFQLPTNWQPDGNSFLNLNVEYFKPDTGSAIAAATLNAVLQVRFDNELAASVTLSPDATSNRNIVVPLRIGLLGILARRTHTIQIIFNARNLCLANLDARLLIRSDLSFFHFEYHESSPTRDLANYPLPFFNQPIGSLVDTAVIVLPAAYSTRDLQAAASIAAELGQLTGNQLRLNVTTANALSDKDQQIYNLIALGQLDGALNDLRRLSRWCNEHRVGRGPGQQSRLTHGCTATSIRPSCDRNNAARKALPT